jgi:hypothetical protein
MDRRRKPRVAAHLSVRVWGVDAYSLPFIELARVKNISGGGAVIQGLRRQVRPGQTLEVQSDEGKAQYRVVWVGRIGSRREGEVGVQTLPSEPDNIWEVNLERCTQVVGAGLGPASS